MMGFLLWPLAIVGAILVAGALCLALFWYLDLKFTAVLKEIDPKDLP